MLFIDLVAVLLAIAVLVALLGPCDPKGPRCV